MLATTVLLSFLWLGPSAPSSERPCTCLRPVDQPLRYAVVEAAQSADAVFSGSVRSVETPDLAALTAGLARSELRVVLEVHRTWKGAGSEAAVVYTYGSSEMCGFEFAEGKQYLVYADRDADGELTVTWCSRTAALDRVPRDELRILSRWLRTRD